MSLKKIGVNLFILKLLLAVFAVPCVAQKDAVFFEAKPDFFEVPLSVKEVTFSFEQLPAHPKAEEVSAAQVIGRVTPYSDLPETAKASRDQIQFRSGAFLQLLIDYRAIRMERASRNKFFDPRSKNSSVTEINWPLARTYIIRFPDSTLARKFVEDAKQRRIEGMEGLSQGWGPEDVQLHGFDIPPNDPRWNDNATGFEHWHLFRGEAYGTETEVAWSMMNLVGRTNTSDVVVAVVEPARGGELTSLRHNDLDWNLNRPVQRTTTFDAHPISVAGVVSAETNNDLGIAGAGYNVMVEGYVSELDAEQLGDYIQQASDRVNIINLSWSSQDNNKFIENSINYAIKTNSVFVVTSAGNDKDLVSKGDLYPASYDGVVTVAATNRSGALWNQSSVDGSNYGSLVDVCAPGEDVPILYTEPTVMTDEYRLAPGTSISAPLVASTAALMKVVNPNLTGSEIRDIVLNETKPNAPSGCGRGYLSTKDAVLEAISRAQFFDVTVNPAPVDAGQQITIDGKTIILEWGQSWQIAGDLTLDGSVVHVWGDMNVSGTINGGDIVVHPGGTLDGEGGGSICEGNCAQPLPTLIDSDLTISGTYVVYGTTVTNGATLTVDAGTTFLFRGNTSLIVEDGAKVDVNGTSSSTVVFKKQNIDADRWNGVKINSPGSDIRHSLFKGAKKSLIIQSGNVVIENSSIKYSSDTGVYAYMLTGNQGGQIKIRNSSFEDNPGRGVYSENVDLLFEGNTVKNNGGDGVVVGGNVVQIKNSTVVNNQFGLQVYDAPGGSVITGTTIRDNASSGVILGASTISTFRNNTIESNGGTGVFVDASSFLYMDGEAKNQIRYNSGNEVHLSGGSARAYLGNASVDLGGLNDIYDSSYGSGNRYVHNGATTSGGSSWTVKAEGNFWNRSPSTSMFQGSVDTLPYLSESANHLSVSISCFPSTNDNFECTAHASGGGGEYSYDWSGDAFCPGSQTCIVGCSSTALVTVTSYTGAEVSESKETGPCEAGGGGCTILNPCSSSLSSSTYETVDQEALQQDIGSTVHTLETGSNDRVGDRLQHLYNLLLLDTKVDRARNGGAGANVFSGRRAAAEKVFDRYLERLAKAVEQNNSRSLTPGERLAGEMAVTIRIENLIRSGRPEDALADAARYEPLLTNADTRKTLYLLRATAERQVGRYSAALATIRRAESIPFSLSNGEGPASESEAVKEWIRNRARNAGVDIGPGFQEPALSAETAAKSEQVDVGTSTRPRVLEVNPPYPDPSTGRFVLPVILPDRAQIRADVYDILGRHVRKVLDNSIPAGWRTLDIDAGSLSSGLYFVQVRVSTESASPQAFTETLTIVR